MGVFGKPTVRRAQLPGGNRMTEKRMPVAERQRETIAAISPPADRDDQPAGYRVNVPGRESGLTRSGESVKRKTT
jgi:hypothetical protein